MKKLLTTVLLLYSFNVFSQKDKPTHEKNYSYGLINLYYTTNNFLGGGFALGNGNFFYGVGLMGDLKQGGVGEHYSTLSHKRYPNEIYQVNSKRVGMYGSLYKSINDKLLIGAKIGFIGTTNYHNAYDKSYILSKSGHYYTTSDDDTQIYVGLILTIDILKIPLYLSYDNLNSLSIGLNLH
jgi:hypothetical protein